MSYFVLFSKYKETRNRFKYICKQKKTHFKQRIDRNWLLQDQIVIYFGKLSKQLGIKRIKSLILYMITGITTTKIFFRVIMLKELIDENNEPVEPINDADILNKLFTMAELTASIN